MIQEMQPRIDMVCDKLNSSLDLSLIQGLQVKFLLFDSVENGHLVILLFSESSLCGRRDRE